MNSETVDLIATDPPFNKGKDFHATPDSLAAGAKFQDRWSWADDIEGDWIDQLEDDWPDVWHVIGAARSSWGDDLGAFLCFMAVRLVEMHRILKLTGSIYLHCDPTASHYLKQLMDAIFGRKQFRNEVVWCYRGGGVPRNAFARKHDLLLFYAAGRDNTFHRQHVPYSEASQALVSSRGGVSIDGRERDLERGASMPDWWTDINSLQTWSPERYGYPTQKPLPLYERIIAASSDPGDIVFDPFCGCATTPVAAERQGRQWVGIDIWDRAHQAVLDRMQAETLAVPDADATDDRLFTFGEVTYANAPPARTDDGETAAPFLQVTERVQEPDGPRWTRAQMYEHLVAQHGRVCQGCDRIFDDERYLQLDHNTPRADGGINHISNRVLLCGPCNQLKSNIYTLSGLRRQNRKLGYMSS
ncbi:DNA methyltransferase [Candidatus Poriferisodalis sp.]|uniref:DNA methyltransferase n=1 Tax=Candidatus Poriferisodalis sp. TaxID=3101277 RepID=UPI003B01CDE5